MSQPLLLQAGMCWHAKAGTFPKLICACLLAHSCMHDTTLRHDCSSQFLCKVCAENVKLSLTLKEFGGYLHLHLCCQPCFIPTRRRSSGTFFRNEMKSTIILGQ
eukprot:2607814-Amphidinium_carterae.1